MTELQSKRLPRHFHVVKIALITFKKRRNFYVMITKHLVTCEHCIMSNTQIEPGMLCRFDQLLLS